jgi:hypothetical protein
MKSTPVTRHDELQALQNQFASRYVATCITHALWRAEIHMLKNKTAFSLITHKIQYIKVNN